MELLGHGIDLVSIGRLQRLISGGIQTASDWLTDAELALASRGGVISIEYLAGRIAAKEAIVKALGTGFAGDISWSAVEVLRGEEGKPIVHLHGALLALAIERGVSSCFLSISHTDEYAMASVMVVGDSPS